MAAKKINQQTRTLELYSPHRGQLEMHECSKRFRIGVWGRQSGKSTWGNNDLKKHAWELPESVHWFIPPTYNQAETQYLRASKSLKGCPDAVEKDVNLFVKLINGSMIEYKSGHIPDNLRGDTLNTAVLDELREHKKETWPLIIRPMLTTTKGRCSFTSTPDGFDELFELVEFAKKHPDEWAVFHHPSTINPLFTLTEYEAARSNMTARQFEQEIEAKFVDLRSGRAYFAFTDANLRMDSPFANVHPQIDTYKPIVIGLDFNLNPMSWVLGQTNYKSWYWFKEIRLEHSNTQEATERLIEILTEYRTQGLLTQHGQYQLILGGDASGKAGQRAAAGKSDYDILKARLKAEGFTYDDKTPEANPRVKDRVNAVNAKFKSANGMINMWINPIGCPWLVKDCRKVLWKESEPVLDKSKDPQLTHMSDAMGYPVAIITPIAEMSEVGTLTVLNR